MRRLFVIALLAAGLAAPIAAQGHQPPPPAQPPQPTTTAPGQQPPPSRNTVGQRGGGRGTPGQQPAVPAAQGRGEGPGGGARREPTQNVRLEVTIMDSAEKTPRKVITMLIRDGDNGRIRSGNPNGGVLNVDGVSWVIGEDHVRVNLSVEYQPDRAGAMLNQSIGVILTPGKPTIISQSADPNTDRKVAVEVTATIIK